MITSADLTNKFVGIVDGELHISFDHVKTNYYDFYCKITNRITFFKKES